MLFAFSDDSSSAYENPCFMEKEDDEEIKGNHRLHNVRNKLAKALEAINRSITSIDD